MKLKVYKLRPNAKIPTRAHDTDAGVDLYYCAPEKILQKMPVFPGETILLGTGIKVEVPRDYMLEIKNKSGIASKKQLLVGACVVDSGYNGEIFINLHNTGKQTHWFADGDKLAQGVMIPISLCEIVEVTVDNLNKNSTRGSGALGSTGSR